MKNNRFCFLLADENEELASKAKSTAQQVESLTDLFKSVLHINVDIKSFVFSEKF